jgi:hypothetical protein
MIPTVESGPGEQDEWPLAVEPELLQPEMTGLPVPQ